jgi:N-acetylneuraminate synthase
MNGIKKIYVIAEAGVNHNGSSEMAFQLVDTAVEAGADAVKFQTFKAENLVIKSAEKAAYQKKTSGEGEPQFEMLKRLELSYEMHHKLIDYSIKKGITFLSTAFDSDSLGFLVNDLGLTTLKLPSGDITNGPLLLEHAQTGCDLILSTGMASLGEVEEALSVIAFGFVNGKNSNVQPSREAFQAAFFSEQGQALLKEKVTVLHCTTEYPAPEDEINLNAMLTMQRAFGLKTGYSDHSEGITVPIAASAMGATLIEKHFTLDKTLPGPDHKASLEPHELNEMVSAIRIVEKVMGNGVKGPMPSEIKNRQVARKSLVASTQISKGECFSEQNITIKRPGTGKSPMEYWDILNEKARTGFQEDELIE